MLYEYAINFQRKTFRNDGFTMNEKDFILINSQDRITINNDIQIVNIQPQDLKNERMRHYRLSTISKEKRRQSKPKNIFSNDKTYKGTSKSIHMPKFKRWGKREDIEMFKLLRKELKSKNIDEKVLLSSYIKDILGDRSQMIEDSCYSSIMEQLAIDTNWLRTPYHLLLRIYNLVMNQEFSFRDEMLLRRLILSESNSDQIDIMEIASSFPGKFMETVDEKVKSIQY